MPSERGFNQAYHLENVTYCHNCFAGDGPALILSIMINYHKRNILWLDCIGGLVVGVIVLMACRVISRLDGLPLGIILVVGIANLVYGSYSLWLTKRKPCPMIPLKILATANIAWLGACIAIVVFHWESISLFGVIHKLGEGAYVATLGFLEWKWRDTIGN